MKTIFLIDTIADDKSIAHRGHLNSILGEKISDYDFRDVHLATQDLSEEDILASDGIVFSGSMRSVYDDFEWKKKMQRIMEIVLVKNLPALATCFGAQFLAYHLGSQVVKNPRGVEFGPVQVTLTDAGKAHPLIGDYEGGKYVFATHQDIIEGLPKGATLLAYNENSPIQAFQFGNILATQFHTDIPTTRAKILLETRRGKYLSCGFLRDQQHYEDLMGRLPLGEQSHDILRRFLESV